MRSPVVALVTALIAVAALTSSYHNNTRITETTRAQNVFLQETFCGILESSAYPPEGVAGPVTPYGQNQQKEFERGIIALRCTPDRNDGK